MTNPNHTDTSRSDDLVERLRGGWNGWTTLTESEAADRIEAQAREIERLREALTAVYNEGDFASVRIATLALGAAYD